MSTRQTATEPREREAIGDRPTEGMITDEAVAKAKAMIGAILRPEGPYLRDATPDTLRNFCNGIGDRNPLFRDVEYGRSSRYGAMIAHPSFPMAYGWIGRTRWGLPGVHGFYAGNDWELFRVVRPGEQLNCVERVVGVEEKVSEFSGRLVMQYTEATFTNQRDELVARVLGWCTRHERRAAREAGKYKAEAHQQYEYSPEEWRHIEETVLGEPGRVRGSKVRYWEDVEEGDELDPIARGPLSLMDTMGFLVGCGRGHTHGVLLENAVKHAGHYFRNPEAGGAVEYTGIGHHRETVAKQVGAPGIYDYGPQRMAWLTSLVANWAGDAGFVKRVRGEMRRFNTMGDTQWCKGRVARKYLHDGHALVDLEIWAENQHGTATAPGLATVILPSRNPALQPVIDGSQCDLALPQIR